VAVGEASLTTRDQPLGGHQAANARATPPDSQRPKAKRNAVVN